jgi:5-methylcytosine-specific restriction endonuclease McrA
MPRRRSRPPPPGPPPPREPPSVCALCGRPLGQHVEWHHVVPKSEGGRQTAPLHPICHHAIHAALPNKTIARAYPTLAALAGQEEIAAFLRWIAGKPPDFHAPTRRRR